MIREILKEIAALAALVVMIYVGFYFALAMDAYGLSALNAPDPLAVSE